MSVIDFFIFVLSGIGITSIIVDSEFFRERKEKLAETIKLKTTIGGEEKTWLLRKIYYMLNCYQCSGFWVGLFLGLLLNPLGLSIWWRPLEAVMAGGLISYLSQMGMA